MKIQEWIDAGRPWNSFILGDCMDLMRLLPNNYFDLAIVDPDYGIERFKRGSLRFDKMNKFKNGLNLGGKPNKKYFDELFRISKNQIIWGANNFNLPETEYFIVWDKKQTIDNFASAEYAWTNIKQPAKIFHYSIHKHNKTKKYHPTQKPVALYRWLLQNYAKPGNKFFDSHVGSASSLIACMEEGFDYVGCELDPDYYKSACERIEIYKSQGRLF